MGCNGHKQKRLRSEESFLQAFEQNLGLHKVKLITLDMTLHRYSTQGGMSLVQLEKAFSELGLDLLTFEQFYTNFYINYQFSLTKLNCLSILLSPEPIATKLKVLFQTYDKDISGTITRSELETMISEIIEVACVLIPKGALHLNPKNEDLIEYIKEISTVRKSISRRLVYAIIENRETITEREFILSYQCDELTKALMESKSLREHCYGLKKNVLGSVQSIINSLNEGNAEVMNILNYKQKKQRKRRSGTPNIN